MELCAHAQSNRYLFRGKLCGIHVGVREKRLKGMPQIEMRVILILGRGQGNLKTCVYDLNKDDDRKEKYRIAEG